MLAEAIASALEVRAYICREECGCCLHPWVSLVANEKEASSEEPRSPASLHGALNT